MTSKFFTAADITLATAGTEQQVSTTATPIQALIVQAASANTGNIFVGDSDVAATRGISLAPGASITISAIDAGRSACEFILSDFWLDTATNANVAKISYIKIR